jgi:hypothetical protein
MIGYRICCVVQSLRTWLALRSASAFRQSQQQASQGSEWEAVERLREFQMRKRGPGGKWLHREPTEEEREQDQRIRLGSQNECWLLLSALK